MNKEIHWEITNRCNLKCCHCLLDAGKSSANELTLDEAMGAVDKLYNAGVDSIAFTGGEPFCYPNFKSLLKKCVRYGIKVQIITNSTLLDEEMLQFICQMGISLGLSIDAFEKDDNDSIRGQGAYESVLSTLESCKHMGIAVGLYVTLNDYVIDHVEDILKLKDRFSLEKIHFNDLTIDGRMSDNLQLIKRTAEIDTIELLNKSSIKICGEELYGPEKSCWAEANTLLMNSEGNLYLCTEVKRVHASNSIGNIKYFDLKRWMEDNQYLNCSNYNCCYWVYYNSFLSYCKNVSDTPCCLNAYNEEIKSVNELYNAFDKLNQECSMSCESCSDPDCMGYIWLLKEEADILLEKEIEVVEINNKISFINSFRNEKGDIDLTICKPKCVHRCKETGHCLIRDIRPLTCHMYPFGPETIDGTDVWVLHTDCKFVKQMEQMGQISEYCMKANHILQRMSKELSEQIKQVYHYVDYLSEFPEGPNSFLVICQMK